MTHGFGGVVALAAVVLVASTAGAEEPPGSTRVAGYVGCWYSIGATKDEFKFKYSGGMATYPQQHAPIAVYDGPSNRTYFVYGGANEARTSILHMVSYFDHATGTVPRPVVLLDKKTTDAHDNPVLQVDEAGYLWVFSNSHGAGRPSFIHRSLKPRSIDGFERILKSNFSYGNAWVVPGHGFLFLHTKYAAGRGLRFMTSPDGREWSGPTPLAKIDQGDYQVSWRRGGTVGTAFDYHPRPLGLDARTNLYYLQTPDAGATWTTAGGHAVTLPLAEPANAALVRDFAAEGKLVYLKDLNFDAEGRPVVLFLTSKGHLPGPKQGPHQWQTAHWTGEGWRFRPFTTSDHNYDHGSLSIEAGGLWRVIAPTEPGPQPYGTGGEMVIWTSADEGATWLKGKQLTVGNGRNQTYARRPLDARPDFYALWADGDARAKSESSLYFTDREGSHVWRLPARVEGDSARPEVVK
ncbi:BNR-4 repeat-containing protein [Isosphaeraceae bacterium EP7]